jgi:general secretion pathway protein M
MNVARLLGNRTSAPPYIAALLYACLLLVLVAATIVPLKNVLDQQAAVGSLGEMLHRLESRHKPAAPSQAAAGDTALESAFLEGSSETIAGAALLQRVVGTVTRHGGSVSSSELAVQDSQTKDGFIGVTAAFDLEQAALQQVIYDLEAGMPFLFIDQLVVQGPTPLLSSGEKLRVQMSVSGKWQGPQ